MWYFTERLGGLQDGAKWVCDAELIKEKSDKEGNGAPCLVYSFGSNGNFVFEQEIIEQLRCEVHIFDFDNFTSFAASFPRSQDRSLVHFHQWYFCCHD